MSIENSNKKVRRKWKLYTALIIVVALTVGSVAAVLAFRALPADQFAELDEVDRTMFTQLSEQYDTFRTNASQIWNEDYRYDLQPLILVRSTGDKSPFWKYTYLINMSDIVDTSDMRPVSFPDELELGDVYVSNTFALNEFHLWLPGNFSVLSLPTGNVLAFKYNADRFADTPVGGLDFEHFSLHEAFHTQKQADWEFDHGDAAYMYDYPFTDNHFDLLEVEFLIFDQINDQIATQPDIDELRRLGTDLSTIRLARYELWPQLTEGDNLEAIEGTANYVEVKYGEIRNYATSGTTTFSEAFSAIKSGDVPSSYLERDIFYSTGAVIGLLLDVVEPSWKTKIEPRPIGSASTPFQTLQEALGVEGPPSPELLKKTLERYP